MASCQTAGTLAIGKPHSYDLPQQANSGGLRLAQEFDAKTNIKGLPQESCSPYCAAQQEINILGSKQPRDFNRDLRMNTTWQDGSWNPNDSSSPLINAAYPPCTMVDSPEKPGTSSYRSSFSRQNSEEPPFKRQYSDSDSYGSHGGSKSRRSSLTVSPTKDRKGRDWVITTADGGQCIEPDGLHFLLKTCELLDPGCASRVLETVKGEAKNSPRRPPTRAPRNSQRRSQTQSPTKPNRRQQGSMSEPQHAPRLRAPAPVGEIAYFRPDDDSEDDYMPSNNEDPAEARPDSDDDYEYLPRRASSSRGAGSRSSRAAARAAAVAAQQQQNPASQPLRPPGAPSIASDQTGAQEGHPSSSSLHSQPDNDLAATTMRVSSHEEAAAPISAAAAAADTGSRGPLVIGPCMNPDCEHPYDSPQWRKGPPNAPVLCNACGTRWLRNGTLKPLVPRRGIRYKNKPRTVSVLPTGKAAKAAAATTAVQRREQQLQAAATQHTERGQQQMKETAGLAASELCGMLERGQNGLPAGAVAQHPELLASARIEDKQYQQYCQLAAALGAAEGAGLTAGPAMSAAGGAAVAPAAALTLLNPALLAALLGGQVSMGAGTSGYAVADQLAAATSGTGAATAWLQQQQQQQADLAQGPKVPLKKGRPVRNASRVIQLQAMAGPHLVAPVFLAAPPPTLFQQQQ